MVVRTILIQQCGSSHTSSNPFFSLIYISTIASKVRLYIQLKLQNGFSSEDTCSGLYLAIAHRILRIQLADHYVSTSATIDLRDNLRTYALTVWSPLPAFYSPKSLQTTAPSPSLTPTSLPLTPSTRKSQPTPSSSYPLSF